VIGLKKQNARLKREKTEKLFGTGVLLTIEQRERRNDKLWSEVIE